MKLCKYFNQTHTITFSQIEVWRGKNQFYLMLTKHVFLLKSFW